MNNPFFKNKGPIKIDDILISANINNKYKYVETNILDIKDLVTASNTDITFFHSKKYEAVASITKAAYCLTTKQLSSILPNNCKPIEVDNVLISTAIITKIFYPDSVNDDFDPQTENIEKTILVIIAVEIRTLSTSIGLQFFGNILDNCLVVKQ